jgi:hypothetical protein
MPRHRWPPGRGRPHQRAWRGGRYGIAIGDEQLLIGGDVMLLSVMRDGALTELLKVMDRDAKKMRGERPFVFSNLKTGKGLPEIIAFVEGRGLLAEK